MTYTFDLITEPWIPCLDPAGRPATLGLQDVILRAHEMREIAGESPPVTAAIYRLLIALLHRVYGPPDADAWEALWQAGRWDPAPLDAYLDRWRDRFDLFHPEHPFLQQKDGRLKQRSVTVLLPHVDARDTLFEHSLDEDRLCVRAPQAAGLLLASQLFDLSGGCFPQEHLYFDDGPVGRSIAFVLQGETLFHTQLLNLPAYPRDDFEPSSGQDRPAWESDDPLEPERSVPLGRLDLLTWPSRRIWLVPRGPMTDPEVEQLTIGPGLRLGDTYRDPMKHYAVSKERGYRPMKWQEERALWRDSASLLQLDADAQRPVLALDWAAALVSRRRLERGCFYLTAYGMLTESKQDKIHTYLQASLPVPTAYLQNRVFVDVLSEAVQLGDQVAAALARTAHDLAAHLVWPNDRDDDIARRLKRNRKEDGARVNRLTEEWAIGRRYWPPLDLSFRQLLETLPEDPDARRNEWASTVRERAREAFYAVVAPLELAPRNLKATVRARDDLESVLRHVLDGGAPQNLPTH